MYVCLSMCLVCLFVCLSSKNYEKNRLSSNTNNIFLINLPSFMNRGMNVNSLQSISTLQQPVTACTPVAMSLYDQFMYTSGRHEITD